MNAQLKPMDNGLSPLRVGRVTGSRCAAVLGLNPYSARADVLRDMVREACGAEREFTGNAATEHGQRHESDALAAYEAREGVMTYGGGECLIHPQHAFLAVTPDGLVGSDGMVECKAPYRGQYTTAAQVPYYLPQMQLQMAVAGRKWCDFVIWRDGAIWVDRIAFNPDWLPSVLPTLQAFMADYTAALAAPDDHLADKCADMEPSPEWHLYATDYTLARFDESAAKARADAAREKLIEMAKTTGCKSAKGAGLQVIRAERSGSVAYAKAIKDLAPGADLSEYTSPSTTYFTVKETK